MPQTGGVFQTGPSSNFFIQGGKFVQNASDQPVHSCYDANDGFKHLQAHVAPAAYATQQEGDAPKCHPNTRTAILDTVMDWVVVATMGLQWMLWINGAAGAGKSAIGRSIVDMCLKQEIVIARFFFSRTDSTRNTIQPVVATLAYQLIRSIPSLDAIISPKIQCDPLIFNESLETQFNVLIFESLKQFHKESPLQKSVVFLVDGVDECRGDDTQENLIRTMAQFVAQKVVPLIVIVASRSEPQLQKTFNTLKINDILRRLPLDIDYRASDDIRLFLEDSVKEIKNTHMFRSSIDPEWPTPLRLQEIVNKSSNQFIYASLVIKFISSPRFHPVHQLEIVRGLRPAGQLTPFAQLDALYRHIFSQVHDITRVTAILAVAILSFLSTKDYIHFMLDLANNDIDIALADLTSVISPNKRSITFLHASLPDFLLDQSRAQRYYIDKGLWCEQLALTCLRKGIYDPQIINTYLNQARCTPQLQDALYTYDPSSDAMFLSPCLHYIDIIHKMDFGDGGELYRHHLDLIARYVHKRWPEELYQFGEDHDISAILDTIRHEKEVARKSELPLEEETSRRIENSSKKRSSRDPLKSLLSRFSKRK